VPVTVANNGSCAFFVTADGFSMTYQWHRNGTNLLNGGNISGATSPTLVISPAGTADALSGANGYYVTVTGAGNYSTNSVTNSLTLRTAASLVYSGSGPWDLNTSSSWVGGLYFNFGDSVTFDDVGGGGNVTLTGSYLSASSVTVNHSSSFYTFQGSGSFAGPGNLSYTGGAQFTINNANTYSGGTLISNATANLRLQNINGLGTGPVTLALAGGQIDFLTASSASSGIRSDFNVQDDFTFVVEPVDTAYAVVFNGGFSGTAGKTLTINQGSTTPTRVTRLRAAGANFVYNANLNLNNSAFLWAFYEPSGAMQTYNGVISGAGALMSKGGITYLNGANTYSGGTYASSDVIGLGNDSALGTGSLFLYADSTSANPSASCTVLASGGARSIGNALRCPSTTNNVTLIVGGTNNIEFTGPFTLNGDDAFSPPVYTNRTIQVTNTALTIFSGVISDGGNNCGLIKTGNGVLALNNTETYTGPTTVSAGTLQVSGALNAASTVTVNSNATLAGAGTVGGNVTVNQGGAIAPGNSIGMLTINNNLTLGGNLRVEVDRSGFANDKISVSGTLTNSGTGTVTVSNLGAALAPGDSFTLFNNNKPLLNGGALTVSGAGAIWTNKLALDGTIAVQSVIATTGTNISYSVSGTNLTLSWPPDYLTWTLQSNAVSVVSPTNWYAVPNSTNVTSIVIPIYPSKTNVFYRLSR
jgi:autotransporter-associated beta strand protein